ncbi:MAG: TFIIB-type zinc ribbon-containing protein [Candidatus Woesearchaeota archaeon]|jgi:ribosomal protein S27AE|nr:TFIIB-type zinc ribbon-containing protein [Candidatus Woesearchaeota archaeon]MDP7457707.1 TFIIB-type zinc ribbon-containing protein [Candidatus Woesearchaeota archaeon]
MAKVWNQKSMQTISSEDTKRLCPECKSDQITNEHGEIFCKKCGFVLND